jgi:hypothetical protein
LLKLERILILMREEESTGIIVTAELAEIAAGSIAMGLGGYLAAKSNAEHYAGEQLQKQMEIRAVRRWKPTKFQECSRATVSRPRRALPSLRRCLRIPRPGSTS